MLPDRVSNPGPLTYESGALPIALRGPADLEENRYRSNRVRVGREKEFLSRRNYISTRSTGFLLNFSMSSRALGFPISTQIFFSHVQNFRVGIRSAGSPLRPHLPNKLDHFISQNACGCSLFIVMTDF